MWSNRAAQWHWTFWPVFICSIGLAIHHSSLLETTRFSFPTTTLTTPTLTPTLTPAQPQAAIDTPTSKDNPSTDTMASTLAKLTAIVHDATTKHTATVIFLHGFGDSGAGWAPVGEQLSEYVPHVKFIFPNAPTLPITANGGMRSPAWYDIKSLSTIQHEQDEQGLLRSRQQVMELVREEVDKNKIPANRIVLGGFSQGCVLSLLVALTSEYKFAGVTALSGYVPLHTKIMTMVSDANRKTPIFWGHGDADQVVKYKYGEQSVEFLKENKYSVRFRTYPRMGHSACPQELGDLLTFFNEVIPEELPVMAKA